MSRERSEFSSFFSCPATSLQKLLKLWTLPLTLRVLLWALLAFLGPSAFQPYVSLLNTNNAHQTLLHDFYLFSLGATIGKVLRLIVESDMSVCFEFKPQILLHRLRTLVVPVPLAFSSYSGHHHFQSTWVTSQWSVWKDIFWQSFGSEILDTL